MKCKICNTQTINFEDTALKKSFSRCPCCEFIFLDKKFHISLEDEKKQYNYHNNSFEDSGYVKMLENFLDYFWKETKPKTALDFGSGPGPVLYEIMRQRGVKTECYDKFYQTKKVYIDKRYDLITSTEVFEHLDNPKEVLKLLASHLSPNGVIAIMTLFHTNKQEDFLKWWYRRDPTHIGFFTPKSVEIMAEKYGLKVLKHDNKRIITLAFQKPYKSPNTHL